MNNPLYSIRLLLFCVLALGCSLTACRQSVQEPAVETPDAEPADTVVAPQEITLLFAGDLMQHKPQFVAALTADGTYDYSGCFDEVRPIIESADVAIANFETTLGGKDYAGYPQFCSPDAYAKAIQEAGFDILLTANNHSCDTRRHGIERTISVLDTLGIPHLGTYVDSVAREAQYPFMLNQNGFCIALLNYTYGTNGIPVPKPSIVNLIDTVQMMIDIEKAQAQHPDAIIAFMHWGIEYVLHPRQVQVDMANWLLAHGVTHVIGGHPHVCQPIEFRTDTVSGERHLVVYSLGNYVSHMVDPKCTVGLMVRLTLKRDAEGVAHASAADYQMCWVDRPVRSRKRVHRVLPIDYPDSLLSPLSRAQRDEFLPMMRKLFEEENIGINEVKCKEVN